MHDAGDAEPTATTTKNIWVDSAIFDHNRDDGQLFFLSPVTTTATIHASAGSCMSIFRVGYLCVRTCVMCVGGYEGGWMEVWPIRNKLDTFLALCM